MDIVRRNYLEVPTYGAPHYHSVRAGNMLFLSGLTAKLTEAEYGDMGEQTEAILKMMKHIVESEGGSMDNYVKITNFVTDISTEATAASRGMRRKFFGENLPASTRVQVVGLIEPNLKIEIEAIAVLPD
ncbi:MAG: RidA family protein [Chloroflexi bacterium]|nr:RidA family protein [Chloroflexota bacterium]